LTYIPTLVTAQRKPVGMSISYYHTWNNGTLDNRGVGGRGNKNLEQFVIRSDATKT